MAITRGIRVIEKPVFKEDNWRFWNLRRTEEEKVMNRSHWLCIEEECDWHQRDTVLKRLDDALRRATLGFQLWCLKGWDGLTINVQVRDGEMPVENVSCAEPYEASKWSRMMDLKTQSVAELSPLIEGVFAMRESNAVQLINPLDFLEIGLQTAFNHIRAGALLWTAGLDALLTAEKQVRFAARLKSFLGSDTRVFPPDWIGRRPLYKVEDVAANMFDLRNLLAHGKEILPKYREPIRFKFEPEGLTSFPVEDWTYEMLLYESSLFTLIAALRKIIADGIMQTVADRRAWDALLDSRLLQGNRSLGSVDTTDEAGGRCTHLTTNTRSVVRPLD
jgi:hypothetical protein